MRGRRFLAYSVGALASAAAAGRLVRRVDARRPDPERDEPLGAVRGTPRRIRGPGGSHLYTERFLAGAEGGAAGTAILTHGYCLTEAVWHYQKRDLAGGPYDLVTWDLPGHGDSPALPPGRLTLDLAADSLARVVREHATPDGVVLVGHSLGGVVTLAYLVRHAEQCRDVIRGVVLVSTPLMYFARSAAGRWPGASVEARALGKVVQAVVESDRFDRVVGRDVGTEDLSLSYRLVRWGFGRRPSPSQVRFVRDQVASISPEVRRDTYRIMAGYDLRPELPSVTVPALVVAGRRDRLVNPEEAREMARRLPRARLVELPDAGHAAILEEHARLTRELDRFARRRLGSPRERAG
jgi:pimeloyl-ACP methyl ester carboxylesterase